MSLILITILPAVAADGETPEAQQGDSDTQNTGGGEPSSTPDNSTGTGDDAAAQVEPKPCAGPLDVEDPVCELGLCLPILLPECSLASAGIGGAACSSSGFRVCAKSPVGANVILVGWVQPWVCGDPFNAGCPSQF